MNQAGFRKVLAVGVAIFGLGLCAMPASAGWGRQAAAAVAGTAATLAVARLWRLWLWLGCGYGYGGVATAVATAVVCVLRQFVLRHAGRLFRLRLQYVRRMAVHYGTVRHAVDTPRPASRTSRHVSVECTPARLHPTAPPSSRRTAKVQFLPSWCRTRPR